jgi:hypothetical protein
MLALLTWLAGTIGLGYLVTHYHLWRTLVAVLGDLVFIAWVLLGAAWLSRVRVRSEYPETNTAAWAKHVQEIAAKEEAARKERASVTK